MLSDLSNAHRVWGVFSVKPRHEKLNEVFLSQEGFNYYCPRLKRRKGEESGPPLFPGYIFVLLSPKVELGRVKFFPGMLHPLLFGGLLAYINPEVVECWKKREAGRGYLAPEPKAAFKVGQKVRFTEGAFTGLEGMVLEDLPAKDRVRILLEYLRMSVTVETDRTAVKMPPAR